VSDLALRHAQALGGRNHALSSRPVYPAGGCTYCRAGFLLPKQSVFLAIQGTWEWAYDQRTHTLFPFNLEHCYSVLLGFEMVGWR
jgi:hypothetical protein